MAAIDVGAAAIDRDSAVTAGTTYLNISNPVNATGIITSFEIYAFTGYSMTGTNKVGTFSVDGSGNYTPNDFETIGTVTAGSTQTFSGLDCDATIDDIVGMYFSVGGLEKSDTGGSGVWYKAGDQFGAGQQLYFLYDAAYDISVYGEGTAHEAPTVTTQAASAIEQTTVTGNGNITDTGGVNATRRGFCYRVGTSGDPTTADSVAYDDGDFGTGAYTKGLTGLSAATDYRIRAYAVNSEGTSYGVSYDFETLGEPIDMGAGAINRASFYSDGLTSFGLDNPANLSGTITSVEIWAHDSMLVGTIKIVTASRDGAKFTPRDSVTIGNVTAGSKQTITTDESSNPIALEVKAGDYLGIYFQDDSGGDIEADFAGFSGVYFKSGDQTGAGEQTYTLSEGTAISLYATGDAESGVQANIIMAWG